MLPFTKPVRNDLGLSLAVFGILPLVLAATAQSLPDPFIIPPGRYPPPSITPGPIKAILLVRRCVKCRFRKRGFSLEFIHGFLRLGYSVAKYLL